MRTRNVARSVENALIYLQDKIKAISNTIHLRRGEEFIAQRAIAGLKVTLLANLLFVASEVIEQSLDSGNSDSKKDLLEILKRFDAFVHEMIGASANE